MVPRRGTETFISTIGQLDGRIDLHKGESLARDVGGSVFAEGGAEVEMWNRALMDLCIMASKLAYENAQVVYNVVVNHWEASCSVLFCSFSLFNFCFVVLRKFI